MQDYTATYNDRRKYVESLLKELHGRLPAHKRDQRRSPHRKVHHKELERLASDLEEWKRLLSCNEPL